MRRAQVDFADGGKDLHHCCFIIQAVPPYHEDLLQILALPSGFRYRSRYSERWVEPSLRRNSSTLIGRRVLLIARDREDSRLIPVRWGQLDVVEERGDIFYFEYVLNTLVQYGSTADLRAADIDRYTRTLRRYHAELPGSAGHDLVTPSVFLSTVGQEFSAVPADDLRHWGYVASAVATANAFFKVDFLRVVDLRAVDGKPARIERAHFLVSPNSVYELEIFQVVPNFGDGKVLPHDITLVTFSEHIALLRARQRAVGKYDTLKFVLKVLEPAPQERLPLEVQPEPSGLDPEGGQRAGPVYLPLLVRADRTILTIGRAVLVLAALGLMLAPGISEVVRNIATVFFILLVAGLKRTVQSLWPSLPWR